MGITGGRPDGKNVERNVDGREAEMICQQEAQKRKVNRAGRLRRELPPVS
jgi:hypothetical protein